MGILFIVRLKSLKILSAFQNSKLKTQNPISHLFRVSGKHDKLNFSSHESQ